MNNVMFYILVERINIKMSRGKLSGNVNCVGELCFKIPSGSIANVLIIDTSRPDISAVILGSKTISNIVEFPFFYEVEYDKANLNKKYGQFSIRAEIIKDNIVYYTTDTQFSIINEKFEPLPNVDIYVTGIRQQNKTLQLVGGLNENKQADSLVKGYVNQVNLIFVKIFVDVIFIIKLIIEYN